MAYDTLPVLLKIHAPPIPFHSSLPHLMCSESPQLFLIPMLCSYCTVLLKHDLLCSALFTFCSLPHSQLVQYSTTHWPLSFSPRSSHSIQFIIGKNPNKSIFQCSMYYFLLLCWAAMLRMCWMADQARGRCTTHWPLCFWGASNTETCLYLV